MTAQEAWNYLNEFIGFGYEGDELEECKDTVAEFDKAYAIVDKVMKAADEPSDLVQQLLDALVGAEFHLDYCGYGDAWEREGTKPLADQIEAAISAARSAGYEAAEDEEDEEDE